MGSPMWSPVVAREKGDVVPCWDIATTPQLDRSLSRALLSTEVATEKIITLLPKCYRIPLLLSARSSPSSKESTARWRCNLNLRKIRAERSRAVKEIERGGGPRQRSISGDLQDQRRGAQSALAKNHYHRQPPSPKKLWEKGCLEIEHSSANIFLATTRPQ